MLKETCLFKNVWPFTGHKEIPTQVFSCEICKTFKNTFFTEYIRWLLLKAMAKIAVLEQAETQISSQPGEADSEKNCNDVIVSTYCSLQQIQQEHAIHVCCLYIGVYKKLLLRVA